MLTVENLKKTGADVESGIARCAGNEEFYLKIAGMVINSAEYDVLAERIAAKDLEGAFSSAHSLKGIVANASLDDLLAPVSEMTELLRAGNGDADYDALLAQMYERLNAYKALLTD